MSDNGTSDLSKLQEHQMFLERDVERLAEQSQVLLERVEELTKKLTRIEGRVDGLLEIPFEGGVDELDELDELAPE